MLKHHIINALYVDDEEGNLTSFRASFRRTFNVFTAISAEEAEIILSKNVIHVLIVDQKMPIKTGTELLAEMVKKYPTQSRILLTAFGDKQVLIDAINEGKIYMYLEKPWDNDKLERAIKDGYSDFYYRENLKQEISNLTRTHNSFKKIVRNRK